MSPTLGERLSQPYVGVWRAGHTSFPSMKEKGLWPRGGGLPGATQQLGASAGTRAQAMQVQGHCYLQSSTMPSSRTAQQRPHHPGA